MGFLKKLFGGGGDKKSDAYVDKNGIYFYVQVDNLDSRVKVRADRVHDLMQTESGYVWHKTIVDSKYFKRMKAVVHFDQNYTVTDAQLDGGAFITEAEYEAAETAAAAQKAAAEAAAETEADEHEADDANGDDDGARGFG